MSRRLLDPTGGPVPSSNAFVTLMHVLDNRTAYSAERVWLRDKHGAHLWVVAVKATFDIDELGHVSLADEQLPPNHAPTHVGEAGESSVAFDADLTLPKPTTDVLVTGSAHQPSGRPGKSVAIALRFPGVQKTLQVRGPSFYSGSGAVSGDFVSQPVGYEAAFGGADRSNPDPAKHRIDLRNPIGVGYVSEGDLRQAPSVVYPGKDESASGPAGFGPTESFWEPRIRLHGTFDAGWVTNRRPFLPADWRPESSLSSPADQRPQTHLRGGELFEVVHMTPGSAMRFTLPKLYFAFRTYFGSRTEEHRAKLSTVHILPEARKACLVWQTALPVRLRDIDALDRTLIRERPYV